LSTDPIAPPDIEAFFTDLAKAFTGKYTEEDRYREFRQVFLDTEQGRRVLYQILRWGHKFASSAKLAGFDPYKTMFHEGERNMALHIFATIHQQPQAKPQRQTSKKVTNVSQQ
jgi:hypothetical protein